MPTVKVSWRPRATACRRDSGISTTSRCTWAPPPGMASRSWESIPSGCSPGSLLAVELENFRHRRGVFRFLVVFTEPDEAWEAQRVAGVAVTSSRRVERRAGDLVGQDLDHHGGL